MDNKIELTQELSQNFLDFSHEVNYQRAFADARDGLKPGQRACIWEMYQKGYKSNKPHVKSAKISGGVIANWWPHSDAAIYDTFARMSQKWINNIPEIDWHGANGSVQISGEPAASRYTEARLSKIVEDGMLCNINKNNVPMKKNFSEDDEWPVVLPALFPRLLVNGCQGIGSTIANVWLCHSFTEVAAVIDKYFETGTVDYTGLAPSFPSGGIIINKDDMPTIYKTGKGKVILRAKTEIKDDKIIITEIPYQVYVEPLIEEIKKYAIENEDCGIENVINKSAKDIRIEIECSKEPNSVLKKLFANTNLQKTYNANQYALADGVPKLLTLQDYIQIYAKHNIECINREAQFDLKKAQERKEIVDGLLHALADIDSIILIIKESSSAAEARKELQNGYGFTENQAKAIVDMKLGKLAGLEQIELQNECAELTEQISKLTMLLSSEEAQEQLLRTRLKELVAKYGDARRTELAQIALEPKEKEIATVEPEDCVVIASQDGTIKRVPAAAFKVQKRNGKGVKTADSAILDMISTNTVDTLMIFTNTGKMYRLLVDNVPTGTNASKGVSIASLVNLEANEKVIAVTSLHRKTNAEYAIFITKQGLFKKTKLEEYTSVKRGTGISAIKLKDGDSLANVTFVKDEEFIIVTKKGMSIRFASTDVNPIGRVTAGVKSIKLDEDDEVIVGLPIHNVNDSLAVFSAAGFGKKTPLSEFPQQGRAGKGLAVYRTSDSTGDLVGAALVSNEDNILIIGLPNSICISAAEIPAIGRVGVGNAMLKNSKIKSIVKI